MHKCLIARLRALSRYEHDDATIGDEAADALEAMQATPKWWTCRTHGDAMPHNAWGCPECVRELRDRVKELEAMQADAARYQWLRGGADIPSESNRWARWEVKQWDGRWWNTLFAEQLDAAIDAARGKGMSTDKPVADDALPEPCPSCGAYSDQAFTAVEMRAAIAAERERSAELLQAADHIRAGLEAEIERLRQQLADAVRERDVFATVFDGFTGRAPSASEWRGICDKAAEIRRAIAAGAQK